MKHQHIEMEILTHDQYRQITLILKSPEPIIPAAFAAFMHKTVSAMPGMMHPTSWNHKPDGTPAPEGLQDMGNVDVFLKSSAPADKSATDVQSTNKGNENG